MSLPLYKDLPTPSDMTRWDTLAMKDLPPVMLMENASREVWHSIKRYKTFEENMPVLIFMGGGNNGGDGAAIGRLLHEEGCHVIIFHTVPLSSLQGATKEHVVMAKKCGISFYPLAMNEDNSQQDENHFSETLKSIRALLPSKCSAPSIIIDALTGTGLKGSLKDTVKMCIDVINYWKENSFIVSIDIPSGLDGLEGIPLPVAVKADITVTFEAPKPGLYLPKAKQFTGNLHICKIGIPKRIKEAFPASWNLLSPQRGAWAKPEIELHKGKAGKVAILGGSIGMTGAPFLSALGALRAGAGIVRVFSPCEATNLYAIPEIMSLSVDTTGRWGLNAVNNVITALQSMKPDALVLGPGMGRNPEVVSVLKAVLETKRSYPIILDADALYFFNEIKDSIQPQDILTPHPQEMIALLPRNFFCHTKEATKQEETRQEMLTQETTKQEVTKHLQKNIIQSKDTSISIKTKEIQERRAMAIEAVTSLFPFTIVLKGAGTLIGQKNMPITLCPKDVPSLAVGGSGDVLSGVIAAVACSKISSYDAASLGVYLHAKSGEILQKKSPKGHLASDIANTLPFAWQELLPVNESEYKMRS